MTLPKRDDNTYDINEFLIQLENDLCELNADLAGRINESTDIDNTIILLEAYDTIHPLYDIIFKMNLTDEKPITKLT